MTLEIHILAISASVTVYVAEKNDITSQYEIQYIFATACVFSMLKLRELLRGKGLM